MSHLQFYRATLSCDKVASVTWCVAQLLNSHATQILNRVVLYTVQPCCENVGNADGQFLLNHHRFRESDTPWCLCVARVRRTKRTELARQSRSKEPRKVSSLSDRSCCMESTIHRRGFSRFCLDFRLVLLKVVPYFHGRS